MARYESEIKNLETGESILIKSNDPFILQQKIEKQKEKWQKQAIKRHSADIKAEKSDNAAAETAEAMELIASYSEILASTLKKNDRIDWAELKDKSRYPTHKTTPAPTRETFLFFTTIPKKSIFEALFSSLRLKRERAEQAAEESFKVATAKHANSLKEYEDAKSEFLRAQREHNAKIDSTREAFERGEKDAIEYYINLVLERSEYPESIILDTAIRYEPPTKTMHVEMQLPMFDDFQFVTEVKYVAAKDFFQTKTLGKSESKELYAEIVYQIGVRTLHEIYEAEYTGGVHHIEFTGFVFGIDPRRGTETRTPVLTLKTDRDTFMQFNLARVKPQACAEGLGGKLEKIAYELSSTRKAA